MSESQAKSSKAPKAYFTRAYSVSASHRLHSEDLSDEANRAIFGKCNNPHGHGHNYRIEVTVGGPVDADTGMVINMADLDRVIHEIVVERFDHQNLNLDPLFDPLFSKRVSTTENLTVAIFELLEGAFAPKALEKVRIEETENNFFEYSGSR
jgi:6-pyruvoyltetrahydropterin/6-carboxytetrahydropterin synthase